VLIAIDRSIRRHRRRAVLAGAVLLLTFALVVAHGAMGSGHMSPMGGYGDGDASQPMVAMCLAIAATAAVAAFVAVALLGGAAGRPGRDRAATLIPLSSRPLPRAVLVRARDGPVELQVLRR